MIKTNYYLFIFVMRDTCQKYLALPISLKCWAIPVFLITALVRFSMLIMPVANLLKWANSIPAQAGQTLNQSQIDEAIAVGGLVRQIANHTPWQSLCLVQSISTVILLRLRGISSQLKVGARKMDGQLQAHAWVTVAGDTVNGGTVKGGTVHGGLFQSAFTEAKSSLTQTRRG